MSTTLFISNIARKYLLLSESWQKIIFQSVFLYLAKQLIKFKLQNKATLDMQGLTS